MRWLLFLWLVAGLAGCVAHNSNNPAVEKAIADLHKEGYVNPSYSYGDKYLEKNDKPDGNGALAELSYKKAYVSKQPELASATLDLNDNSTAKAAKNDQIERSGNSLSCDQVGDLAKAVMNNRQTGTPMQRVIELSGGSELMRVLAIMAYERPAYAVRENQDRAAVEFQSQIYLMCIKGRK